MKAWSKARLPQQNLASIQQVKFLLIIFFWLGASGLADRSQPKNIIPYLFFTILQPPGGT